MVAALGGGDMPATAKTAEEITSAAGKIKGYGFVQSAEFNRLGRRIFALWYCPFSGRAACYLRVYYYDVTKAEWRRFVDQLVEHTHDLSAEMPWPIPHVAVSPPGPPQVESLEELIVFRSVKGEIVFKASVADLPQQSFP